MANKVITFVIETVEPELDSILAAAINEIHTLGHKVKEVRVADDSGEVKIPTNTVTGVTVHEPVVAETPDTTATVPAPADPTPVDPTAVPSDTPSATTA